MTEKLYAALVRAQSEVRPVEKDSTNNFHKYNYASGDDVISAARAALNVAGLAAFATEWKVTETPFQWEDEKGGKHDDVSIRLHVRFRVVHESGEALDFDPFGVPVLPEKGRPIDKAEAGARTYALSYFLRDLLLIPRVDAGSDVDQRDDRDRAPRATHAPRFVPSAAPEKSEKRLAAEATLRTQVSVARDLAAHLGIADWSHGLDAHAATIDGPESASNEALKGALAAVASVIKQMKDEQAKRAAQEVAA